MDRETRAAEAVRKKSLCGYNCAQAVVSALADQTGLPEETLVRAAAGFGAGMGTTEATCGALIGAGIAAGLAAGKTGATAYTRQILQRFRTLCGATACRDLKAVTNGKPLCSCADCVKNAVLAYCETFGIE